MNDSQDPRFDRTFGDMPPPPPSKQFFPILSPKFGLEVKAIITSERPLSAWKHFVEKVSYPCTRDAHCPYCRAHHNPRWMGYLAGLSVITGKACIIEVTGHAFHNCPQMMDKNAKLRGKVITLVRRGKAGNSPVMAKIEEATGTMTKWKLPEPFDVKSSILKMWGNPFGVYDTKTNQLGYELPDDFMIPC